MTENITPARVRFAPSPTGMMHIGGVRTALFNWLYARHTGGQFLLRIEDTDQNRKVDGALENIAESLKWLGLDWDEGPGVGGPYGPYVQSERLNLYQDAAKKLVAEGKAYYCWCSSEKLEKDREVQTVAKKPPMYARRCRDKHDASHLAPEDRSAAPVIRFKTPITGQTNFNDHLRGDLSIANSTLDDFVMLKSDGFPTYHLANIVDDHSMKITHVLRAEEWLPSTPRHKLLYDAFGWTPPVFVHLPLILGKDRSKMSKRHGATDTLEYREAGYLTDALVNFLSLLGWSYDDKTEIMSRLELIERFSLERIGKTGAIFDKDKLDWMNGHYIRTMSDEAFTRAAMPYLEKALPPSVKRPLDQVYVQKVVKLEKERVKTLSEVPQATEFFFTPEPTYEKDPKELFLKGVTKEQAVVGLQESLKLVKESPAFTAEPLEKAYRELAEKLAQKPGQLFGTIRNAVSGRTVSPPLFATMETLGRDKCIERMQKALTLLQ